MSCRSFMERLNDIDVDDLQYVETDLCFYQLVSLGFLLYGDDRTRSQFILQKLIVLSQHPPQGNGLKETDQLGRSDILSNYAKLNPHSWKSPVIEALAIIKAKRVVRKLGLTWLEVYQHFLPHVAEICVHIHPLLKALYVICERLTPQQASKLIKDTNSKYHNSTDLRFYDVSYLEIFLINWLNKRLIVIGDKHVNGCNMDILIEYFKFNDMEDIKNLLLETINHNLNDDTNPVKHMARNHVTKSNFKDAGFCMSLEMPSDQAGAESKVPIVQQHEQPLCSHDKWIEASSDKDCQPSDGCIKQKFTKSGAVTRTLSIDCDSDDRYTVSRKNAGYVLIINQSKFYKESDPKLVHLLPTIQPDSTNKRKGTNVDRDKLKEVFSLYGYTPLVFNNLTNLEILHHIRETVKRSLLKDSLIICILSHGREGIVFGCNYLPVAITEIKEILTHDILKGKPKLLIIQACQKNNATDLMKNPTSITDFSPDAYADQLLALSSMPGTEALRHVENGSWFVDSLCKHTLKYGDSKHMLDILTAVTRDISKRKGGENQVMLPYTSSTMRKEFYLPSRL